MICAHDYPFSELTTIFQVFSVLQSDRVPCRDAKSPSFFPALYRYIVFAAESPQKRVRLPMSSPQLIVDLSIIAD